MPEFHKWLVLSDGYHGHNDEFVSLTPPAHGVPPHSFIRALPDDYAEELLSQADAVIIEPVKTDISPERVEWLRKLRADCTKYDVVLIFDEVITGFRFPRHSVSQHFGITPDLICLGKALGNGMPISAVGGKRAVMEDTQYFVSSTFAGERLSLAAAMATVGILTTKQDVGYLWEKGEQFQKHFNSLWPNHLWIEGYGTRGVMKGEGLTRDLFWQEAVKAGLLFGPSWFFNFKHIEVMDQVLSTCQDIVNRIRVGGVKLEGERPQSPFAQQIREAKHG